MTPPAVKKGALEMGVEVFQPECASAQNAVDYLKTLDADIGVVVAFGEILGKDVLETTRRGFLNLHASLLPKYRGAAPINWALIRGESKTGVTVQRVIEKLDAGPVLAQRETLIGYHETAGELHNRLSEMGAELLTDVVNRMEAGESIEERHQDESKVSYAPMLSKDDGLIDWGVSPQDIVNRVRGATPWPGATTHFIGSRREERVTLLEVYEGPAFGGDVAPGTIVRGPEHGDIIVKAGGNGTVGIQRLKPSSSRDMSAADFMHGYRVKKGDRFER
jgi:methionyl-tRNA formyltransferase